MILPARLVMKGLERFKEQRVLFLAQRKEHFSPKRRQPMDTDVSPHDLWHRFGYRMAESVPLHRLAQIMGHDSLDTTRLYIPGTKQDLQQAIASIAWT